MKAAEFAYFLPQELIAQEPLPERDSSRLLVLDRARHDIREYTFRDIAQFLERGDCIVFNDTRVIPARIFCRKETGARIEFLLLKELEPGVWEVLIKPAKRIKKGSQVVCDGPFKATVKEKLSRGSWRVAFSPPQVKKLMTAYGMMPIPPYIKKELVNAQRYQTVYAANEGAVAAPTAGLHFTPQLIEACKKRGARIVYITLHVGLGTFRPIQSEELGGHVMDEERYSIPEEAARQISKTRKEDRRIFAVGTTVARALESAAPDNGQEPVVRHGDGVASLFITPGYRFKAIDCLLTNFHLPDSTNLVLVSSFADIASIKKAYAYAVEQRFRFYSFGDAMLVL